MSWHLAPSLVQLRKEINAKYPKRDRTSDGSIGDTAHSARKSDHNPNSRGSVNAIDIDKDGIDPWALIALLCKDPRVNYVIYNRTIWSRVRGFKASPYKGANPHTGHVHVSILQSRAAEQSTTVWGIAGVRAAKVAKTATKTAKTAPAFPLPAGYAYGPVTGGVKVVSGRTRNTTVPHDVTKDAHGKYRSIGLYKWQQQMKKRGWNIAVDGLYGPGTEKVVKAFQKSKNLTVDGKIGPTTWAKAWTEPIK